MRHVYNVNDNRIISTDTYNTRYTGHPFLLSSPVSLNYNQRCTQRRMLIRSVPKREYIQLYQAKKNYRSVSPLYPVIGFVPPSSPHLANFITLRRWKAGGISPRVRRIDVTYSLPATAKLVNVLRPPPLFSFV